MVSLTRPIAMTGTPTMFVDMLAVARSTRPDVSSVKTGLMAGAPCPQVRLVCFYCPCISSSSWV